ncbi:sulfite exporter TauE/SafE family protein [Flavobacterium sp.]|uniref:sulfite exporter TauE/SafE family protein n=1 Tax=Flavobacterium sp. TaxID=239 RepID=UPI00262913CE|nr:sulfite exporter TauE/SafE family protein [Flavobacterium sp.]
MENDHLVGYSLAVLVGISLGLIGSGGSILSVPIFVYIMGMHPALAAAYSLFVVGISALVSGVQKAKDGLVDFKKVLAFGVPTLIAVFITRKIIVPSIPEMLVITDQFTLSKRLLLMVVFALVMLVASWKMIRPGNETKGNSSSNPFTISLAGLAIGFIAGFVGAGGGFLIVPALLFLANTPIKKAIGTSLFIVAVQSLIGFLGDIPNPNINYPMLLVFTGCALFGVLIGNRLSKVIAGEKLKTVFGYVVLGMGIYILVKEIGFSAS